ncbi:MAG: sigma 54-interacting transcriptional regulator [Planctomycetaceae bacterium]|nr:sigma 54-interacting transcriptional regulator [Planctomycetaceae bacterium]
MLVATCVAVVVTYSVVVLWYVATFPDMGLRCLLPQSSSETQAQGVEVAEFLQHSNDGVAPKSGDRLISINRHRVETFLDVVREHVALRSAQIAPGGQLPAGSDPMELGVLRVPGLVEIYSSQPNAPPLRFVELTSWGPQDQFKKQPYVPVEPVSVVDVSRTITWFVCQLLILGVALAAYWNRPFDRIAQNFCLMCCASMGAFVAGFHWWIVAGNPLLNIIFIVCATLLPALALQFFLVFPGEPDFVRRHRRLVQIGLFAPVTILAILICVVYWTAWNLNGGGPEAATLTGFQKLAAVMQLVSGSTPSQQNFSRISTELLVVLKTLTHGGILLGSLYFLLTVVQLATSLYRIQQPQQRRQAISILLAALISTVPIGYTLYLAFLRRTEFALGRGQWPMFFASMMFMAAYAHGMLRHRLMLADDSAEKSRRYTLTSLGVSGGIAVCLALGGVAAHSYNLPLNSSTAQKVTLFLILLLAASLVLWARDRLKAAVDRRFVSEKYQLDRALHQLNRAAGYLADPSAISDITLKTCEDVIDASFAAMFIRDNSGTFRLIGATGMWSSSSGRPATAPAATTLPSTLHTESIPNLADNVAVIQRIPSPNRESMDPAQRLLHELRAELLYLLNDDSGFRGVIVVGRRCSGAAYTAEDIAFLHAIGQMSVLALHSSQANQNLARLDAELKAKVDRIAEQQRQLAILRAELTSLQKDAGQAPALPAPGVFDRAGIRGNSPVLADVLNQIRKVSRSDSTVLIQGESGTGKELLARVVHRNSDRANAPLVCLNCAALSPSLLESELFGHVRGAFTGAHADKTGRFLAADGGTLFLDEIGEISAETQVKLLRVLQERCFEPVGSDKTTRVNVRLIAATNRDLPAMIESGRFREDLYYRLNVVSVTLPPLRDRGEDLLELVFYFLSRAAQKERKQIRRIHPDAVAALEQHAWPGNIRELENVIERAVVLADSDEITLADLPVELRRSPALTVSADLREPVAPPPSLRSSGRTDPGSKTRTLVLTDSMSPEEEEQVLRSALAASSGNKTQAARKLSLARSTFFSKCKKYGIF